MNSELLTDKVLYTILALEHSNVVVDEKQHVIYASCFCLQFQAAKPLLCCEAVVGFASTKT